MNGPQAVILLLAITCLSAGQWIKKHRNESQEAESPATIVTADTLPAHNPEPGNPILTATQPEQVIEHNWYTVSYNASTCLPNWVAWTLTPERCTDVVARYDKFLPDPEVDNPVTTDDYKGSGYDRGHLCPAADNKWSRHAMMECFYMTNICPQNRNLNAGDWKELEEACRQWAKDCGRIYIVSGPILRGRKHKRIADGRIVVPEAFFKVALSLNPEKAIGFVFENTAGNRPLSHYATTVDEVETIAGMDFFTALPDSIEQRLEAAYDKAFWPGLE